MIIVDTSVWVEFLRNSPLFFSNVQELLENQKVLTIDCIFAELLQGAKDKREREIILSYWNNLPKVEIENLYINAGIYSSENKLISKGIGLIDSSIIISSIHYKAKVWTLDKKLQNALKKENIYYFQS
jgi:predicted nucleic acid-binding protein